MTPGNENSSLGSKPPYALSDAELSTAPEKPSTSPRLPCCEHGYMAGPDMPDVECCICGRNFCAAALEDRGEPIRQHLFAESERDAWHRANPQPNPFEVPW
jgi:hypothetical protein